MLVMSAPTVDITNIDTSNVAQKDIYQQKVITSCNNMFNIAQKSLNQNPNLTKVVIMEHIPRFDSPDNGPSSLKPDLATLANVTIGQLWLNSPLKHKIFIGRHSLESSGAGPAHLARYENRYTGRFDGVHLYGKTGCEDFTNSVKSIRMLALAENKQLNTTDGIGTAHGYNHRNCAQAKFQKQREYQTR